MICLNVKSQKHEYMRDVTSTEYYFENLVHVIRVNQWRRGGNSCLFDLIFSSQTDISCLICFYFDQKVNGL